VRFRVADTGPGIAPEHLARIFEPFEQVGDQRAQSEGTGLGLAITKRLVDQMGGTIAVESALGQGSAFTVTFALPEALGSTSTEESLSWDTITGYQGERRTILVVDDNAENRALLSDLLIPLGFELLLAEGGEAGIRLAVERRPDLILMDLAMPGVDGHEATRRLRQMPELGKAVIITSSANVAAAERLKDPEAGWDDFLPKPVQAQVLLEKIHRFLGVEWTRTQDDGATPGAQESLAVVPPSAEEIAMLSRLVASGRIRNVLMEVERLGKTDPRLAPWLEQLRALARGYQMRKLQEFLEGSAAAPGSPAAQR
jgi:CheY-like chemotaxis protein